MYIMTQLFMKKWLEKDFIANSLMNSIKNQQILPN